MGMNLFLEIDGKFTAKSGGSTNMCVRKNLYQTPTDVNRRLLESANNQEILDGYISWVREHCQTYAEALQEAKEYVASWDPCPPFDTDIPTVEETIEYSSWKAAHEHIKDVQQCVDTYGVQNVTFFMA